MQEHVSFHGRRNEQGAAERERYRAEEIVGAALCETGDGVCSGRGDDQGVRPAGEVEMPHVQVACALVPDITGRLPARDRLEGQRSHEMGAARGQDNLYLSARLHEVACQRRRLERRDAARYTEDNPRVPDVLQTPDSLTFLRGKGYTTLIR
jgi:hypothetical protein